MDSPGNATLNGDNDLPELAASTATTDQHPSNICPCGRGHLWKTSCLQGPARRRPIRSGGRANDGSGESKPARVGWRRRADRRRCGRSLLLGAFPLRPADLGWGTHNKSLERTRPARAFRSIMVLPGRSAQPLCAARRRTVSFIFNISAPPEVIWECIARKDCSRPPSAKRLHSRGEPALKGGNDLQELPSSTAITDQHPSNICL